MNEIDKVVTELINIIDQSEVVQKLKISKAELKKNQALINQINAFDHDINNRKELMNQPEYVDYMHQLNELNYLIMMINSKLKNILSSRSCK